MLVKDRLCRQEDNYETGGGGRHSYGGFSAGRGDLIWERQANGPNPFVIQV